MLKFQMKIKSLIGPLYLVGSKKSLHGIFWEEQPFPMITAENDLEMKLLNDAAKQLEEYFAGKRKKFDLSLDADGTSFQKKVWQELANIPYGETRSYKEIAVAIKNAKACRAVGTANGKNPLSVIVPCHRVISSDGTIGGYAGGLAIKRKLLKLEEIELRP